MLASRTPNEGLVEYFGAALHAELAALARATTRKRSAPRRGAACTCCPASWARSSASFAAASGPTTSCGSIPSTSHSARLTELRCDDVARRRARRDELHLSQDHAVVAQGRLRCRAARLRLAARHRHARQTTRRAHRGRRPRGRRAHRPQHGWAGGARRAHACRRQTRLAAHHARHAELGIAGRGAGIARHVFGGAQDRHARSAAQRRISGAQRVREFSRTARAAAGQPAASATSTCSTPPRGRRRSGSGCRAAARGRRAWSSAWRRRMRASPWWWAAIARRPPASRCATATSNTNTACRATARFRSSSRAFPARATATWSAGTATCRSPIA